MLDTTPITVAYGDGIGPEIMDATLLVLKEAGARISIDTIEIGKQAYERGSSSGIPDSCWNTIRKNKILLKAPITTPQGGGYKSLNVTMRRTLGLYANVRPCLSYYPFVDTKHPKLNMVIVRENEEGLYAGIEHRQTLNSCQSLKLLTRQGCEKINKFAFEYATKNNRKKVTCMSKDNIMKLTDGLFHKVFDEAAKNFPDIENEHYIIDIGAARIAAKPEIFDVVVTGNLYGDIVSDIASEVSGSVGLSGSANIGDEYAMFEAVHGSAPDIAGENIANPSGLLNGAIMMLVHIGQNDVAEKIHNAWLKTIEDGVHTADIYNSKSSTAKAGTAEFAEAVVANLGNSPTKLSKVSYANKSKTVSNIVVKFDEHQEVKKLAGVDIFIDWQGDIDTLSAKMLGIVENTRLKLQMIGSKGLKIWPKDEIIGNVTSDYWRGRFFPEGEKVSSHEDIIELLKALKDAGFDFIKVENLYTFDDKPGFSVAQGE